MATESGSGGARPNVRAVRPTYIHELPDWPQFQWNAEAITSPLMRATRKQAEILGNLYLLN